MLCCALQVLLRTWRQEDDGGFIVLYQSTKHGAAMAADVEGGAAFAWSQPVRAKVNMALCGQGRPAALGGSTLNADPLCAASSCWLALLHCLAACSASLPAIGTWLRCGTGASLMVPAFVSAPQPVYIVEQKKKVKK